MGEGGGGWKGWVILKRGLLALTSIEKKTKRKDTRKRINHTLPVQINKSSWKKDFNGKV